VTTIRVLAAALLLVVVGCSQPNARVQTRFNRDAELSGELPYNPLQWEVMASTLNRNDHTVATVWQRSSHSLRTQEHLARVFGGFCNIHNHMVSAGRPSLVWWKHTGQGAIR